MKIIGSSRHGYIAEIDRSEAEILTGRAGSDYSPLVVGSDYPLHKVWRHLNDVLDVKKKLERLATEFRGMAEITASIDADIPQPTEKEVAS